MNKRNDTAKVFFLGDVALDEYYEAPYWPKLKEKVIVHNLPSQPGGMIANAACVASALGVEAHFFAVLNDGEISQTLIKDLERNGISTGSILFDNALPDSKTIVILAEGEHTIIIPTLGIQRIELPNKTLEYIKTTDYFYTTLCEYQPVTCCGRDAISVLEEIRRDGCRVVFDMDVNPFSEDDMEYLKYIDILFINEKGFAAMQGAESKEKCIKGILDFGVGLVVITEGSKGCSVFSEANSWKIPGIETDVVDVTGAGDTFAAAFLFAYHKWENPHTAALFATGAATRCVEALGARGGISSEQEVVKYLIERGRGSAAFSD